MKCPKCGNTFNIESSICPSCEHINLVSDAQENKPTSVLSSTKNAKKPLSASRKVASVLLVSLGLFGIVVEIDNYINFLIPPSILLLILWPVLIGWGSTLCKGWPIAWLIVSGIICILCFGNFNTYRLTASEKTGMEAELMLNISTTYLVLAFIFFFIAIIIWWKNRQRSKISAV